MHREMCNFDCSKPFRWKQPTHPWEMDTGDNPDSVQSMGMTIGVDFDEQQLATIKRRAEMMAHHAAEVQFHLERMDEHREELDGVTLEYSMSMGDSE